MVAKFSQPDFTTQTAAAYKASIDASVNVLAELAANFAPHEADTPDMTVKVDSGKLFNNGSYIENTGVQTTPTFTAPVTNPRIDRVAIDTETGSLVAIVGDEAASPVAPAYSINQYPVCQVIFLVSQSSILNSDITDERPLINLDGNKPVINWTTPTQIGNGLSLLGSTPAIAGMTVTTVAHVEDSGDNLGMYEWDGSDWALVGSLISLGAGSNYAFARMSDTTLAVADGTLDSLSFYSFNGSLWSKIGSTLTITGVGATSLAALNGTDIAYVDSTLELLRVYRWNGSIWTPVGSTLTITAVARPVIAALNSTDIALTDRDTGIAELRTYRWSGSSWSLLGNALTTDFYTVAITALNGTDIATIDSANNELRTYRWDDLDWVQVGGVLAIPALAPAISAFNGTDVAVGDINFDELRTYRFGFSIDNGPYHV